MTLAADPEFSGGLSACPACVAAPSALDRAAAAAAEAPERLVLSVPAVHCAACISTLEKGLGAVPGVISVRVNLTLKRLFIEARPEVTALDLIPEVAKFGYEAHELDPGLLSVTETDRQGRELLMRIGVAGFSMMNIMLLSVAVWSGASDATRDLFHWISGMIALPTVAFAGQPFFRSAWAGLKVGRLGMDFPISLALVLASSISIYETWMSGQHAYFDAAVMLTFFLLIGRYLDHRTRAVARSAAQELAALEVPRAVRLNAEGAEALVAVAELRRGDRVLVRPGGRMPVDGRVLSGTSEIDRSLLTGEVLPVFAGPGQAVSAGEVNLTGPLEVEVLAAGRDSSLSRMAELVAIAESAKTRYTGLADRAASAYSPLVHLLSFSAFGWWMWHTGGDIRFALNISAATLIITCPCALGLAVPAVLTAASGKLFKKGLLIKSGTALERMAEIDTVIFDKTGTLTIGAPEVTNFAEHSEVERRLAAALAAGSSHPLAQALAAEANRQGIEPLALEGLAEVPGYGIEATWQGRKVRLGRAEWVGADSRDVTATYLSTGQGTAAFTFADSLRPGAEEVVGALLAQGMQVKLLSGDASGAVAEMAARLGIDDWKAEALPEEKAIEVKRLMAEGRKVLMVGDGLNDTAALVAAHASISPATALDAARVASDIVLLGRDLAPVADALRIARQATKRIRENFYISAAYNVVAVPIALVGLATPLWAALAMSTSSITVALNALRLR